MPTKTPAKPDTAAIVITTSIPLKRIANMLCSAFEGGSNYWYFIDKFIKPKNMPFRFDDEKVYSHIDYPLNPGGELVISDEKGLNKGDEKRVERLNLTTIERGLTVMASEYPRHWAAFIADNDDAETADVFLQCCLFGEVIFG